jgi:hypothetical protein
MLNQALWVSSDSIVSVSRTTTSDVLCVINTQKSTPATHDLPRYKTLKPIATLPYKSNQRPKLPDGKTDFSALRNVELKEKSGNELKKERDLFFQKLHQERNEKTYRESLSSVKIQAAARGFLARPRIKPRRKSKAIVPFLVPGAPISNEVQEIQNELCSYAHLLGLKPIPGLSLEARAKHNRRREKIVLAASMRISAFFKLTLVALRARKTVKIAKLNIQERASIKIQRFFRYVHRAIAKQKSQSILRERAVLKIQTRFRIFHDFRRSRLSTSSLSLSPSSLCHLVFLMSD